MKNVVSLFCIIMVCLLPATLFAQGSFSIPRNPPHYPPAPADIGPAHPEIDPHDVLIEKYNGGLLTLDDMRRMGLSVFTIPFNSYDGLGDGEFLKEEWKEYNPEEEIFGPLTLGHRATLQHNGMFMRLHGMDAQSCNECHNIVRGRERPPTLGFGGVGGVAQNAMPLCTLVDGSDSWETIVYKRVKFAPHPNLPFKPDGVADYNGRFINPPFLYGGGGVELLGKEMTCDLQDTLKKAQQSPPGLIFGLATHGVEFGYIYKDLGGKINFDHVEGVSKDLVVRPFNRKGGRFSMRDFDRDAMQFHFGIQPVEVVGEDFDEDFDGYVNEITVGEMTVLHFFDVCNPRPFFQPGKDASEQQELEEGALLCSQIGCFNCHKPFLITENNFLPLAFPEVAEDPKANVYAKINLIDIGFDPAPGGGVFVPLFADLKRHDMGDKLAETLDIDAKPSELNRQFTTARLWGISDTAPYLHDGRATTIYQAIWFHGGEAQDARDWFIEDLTVWQQKLALKFLRHLRVPKNPNKELLPL